MKSHWTNSITNILTAKEGSLKNLAKIANADWRTLYIGQTLAGCNLIGQDLRGMDLTNCDIDKAKIDNTTLIDAEFDPRLIGADRYVNFKIPTVLDHIVSAYASEAGYSYKAWAYKSLIEKFAKIYNLGLLPRYINNVKNNENISEIIKLDNKDKYAYIIKRILLEEWKINLIDKCSNEYPQFNIDSVSILIPALSTKNYFSRTRKFDNHSINDMWGLY